MEKDEQKGGGWGGKGGKSKLVFSSSQETHQCSCPLGTCPHSAVLQLAGTRKAALFPVPQGGMELGKGGKHMADFFMK